MVAEGSRMFLEDRRLGRLNQPAELRWQGCTEPGVQETQVVKVSLAWFVASRMAQHLNLRCKAHHLAPRDDSRSSESGRRICPVPVIAFPRPCVDAVALVVEANRVYIYLPSAKISDHEARIRRTLHQLQAVPSENLTQPGYI